MTILKIYNLDDREQKKVIASLGEGDHIVGRGGILDIKDHRVSRKHAIIKVSSHLITLTSSHTNPCFFKKADGNQMTIIRKDTLSELNDGDTFALLPEEYWYRVRVQKEEEQPQINGKRLNNGDLNEVEAKKAKLSISNPNEASTSRIEGDNGNTLNILQQTHIEDEEKVEVKTEQLSNPEASTSIIYEEVTLNLEDVIEDRPPVINPPADVEIKEEACEAEGQAKIKTEPSTASGNGAPTTTRPRERCWYAAACFRKNPSHREQFSHPGDTDYASDPEDDRPDCPYGVNCYRRNPEHRREYRHSTLKPAPKPSNINVLTFCPHCAHCQGKMHRGGCGKPDYESDVDDDDD